MQEPLFTPQETPAVLWAIVSEILSRQQLSRWQKEFIKSRLGVTEEQYQHARRIVDSLPAQAAQRARDKRFFEELAELFRSG